MVSPGNPLKPERGMAPLSQRLASARGVADGRRVVASAIEQRLATRFTVDTLRLLQRRFPRVDFVWIAGADIFVQLPRWRNWQELARRVPFAVLPRPGYNHHALAGRAAHVLRHARRQERASAILARGAPPAWVFLTAPEHAASASAIRATRRGVVHATHASAVLATDSSAARSAHPGAVRAPGPSTVRAGPPSAVRAAPPRAVRAGAVREAHPGAIRATLPTAIRATTPGAKP